MSVVVSEHRKKAREVPGLFRRLVDDMDNPARTGLYQDNIVAMSKVQPRHRLWAWSVGNHDGKDGAWGGECGP